MEFILSRGFSFGLTSGVITTLGLIIGLDSGTGSKLAVIGGVITIALADAFSDALGIHISEEASGGKNHRDVWRATISTFFAKFIFALTFLFPIILLESPASIFISIIWGFSLLIFISYKMARQDKVRPASVILEHLFIATIVVVATHFLGRLVALYFS